MAHGWGIKSSLPFRSRYAFGKAQPCVGLRVTNFCSMARLYAEPIIWWMFRTVFGANPFGFFLASMLEKTFL